MINLVVTRGYGNATFNGFIAAVVTRGYGVSAPVVGFSATMAEFEDEASFKGIRNPVRGSMYANEITEARFRGLTGTDQTRIASEYPWDQNYLARVSDADNNIESTQLNDSIQTTNKLIEDIAALEKRVKDLEP